MGIFARVSEVERRLDALELTVRDLATKKQVESLSDGLSEIKGMVQKLLDNRAGQE